MLQLLHPCIFFWDHTGRKASEFSHETKVSFSPIICLFTTHVYNAQKALHYAKIRKKAFRNFQKNSINFTEFFQCNKGKKNEKNQ